MNFTINDNNKKSPIQIEIFKPITTFDASLYYRGVRKLCHSQSYEYGKMSLIIVNTRF